jgi:uncharacterized protein YjiS (DUF1127 family)
MSCGSTTHPPSVSLISLPTLAIPAPFTDWSGVCWWFARRLLRVYDRQQQRRVLMELDERMLADIGITRSQAQAEARKPFWLSAQRAFTISN